MEAGVSGLARSREWDLVELVALPELADDPAEELRFWRLADGALLHGSPPGVGERALERAARALDEQLRAPYEAVAVRQTRLEWSVAARELRTEEIELTGIKPAELVVAVGLDGAVTVLADGAPAETDAALASAAARLEAIGRSRHTAFVARALRLVGDRFALSVDPL